MSHTPGPWIITPRGDIVLIAGAESIHTHGRRRDTSGISSAYYSKQVCELWGDLSLPGPASNAALIIASPTMFEYLKELADGGDSRAREIVSEIGD